MERESLEVSLKEFGALLTVDRINQLTEKIRNLKVNLEELCDRDSECSEEMFRAWGILCSEVLF